MTKYRSNIYLAQLIFMLLLSLSLSAQTGVRKDVRAGNKAYQEGNYQRAERRYREALMRDGASLPGRYNLGGSLYRQERYDEAYGAYKQILGRETDSTTMSNIAYNFGNAAIQRYLQEDGRQGEMRSKYLNESIEAYSKALRYDPNNEHARHNLTRALRYRQHPPPPRQQPEEQHQQEKQKEEQPLPETKKREAEREQEALPEHDAGRISKEDAERMLNAIREKEMRTAEQIHERERKRTATPKGKDW
jgi:Ca-activated chloride channel homolog